MKTVLLAGAFLLSSSFMVAQSSQAPASTPPTLPQSQSQPAPDQQPSSTMPSADQSSQTSAGQSSMGSQSADNSSSQKIEGCLAQSGSDYTLADASGTTYKLTGDTSKLSSHVGEQVEIKGMPASGSAASSSGSASTPASHNASSQGQASASGSNAGGASAASASGQSFTVQHVKRISKSCSNAQPKQ
jgi:hypothetical protein